MNKSIRERESESDGRWNENYYSSVQIQILLNILKKINPFSNTNNIIRNIKKRVFFKS